ncbi:hypothetical protein GCM10023075_67710 [Streptosporangium album]
MRRGLGLKTVRRLPKTLFGSVVDERNTDGKHQEGESHPEQALRLSDPEETINVMIVNESDNISQCRTKGM